MSKSGLKEHLFNGLKGPRVCLVGVRVTGLMETSPPWCVTIYKGNKIKRIIVVVGKQQVIHGPYFRWGLTI